MKDVSSLLLEDVLQLQHVMQEQKASDEDGFLSQASDGVPMQTSFKLSSKQIKQDPVEEEQDPVEDVQDPVEEASASDPANATDSNSSDTNSSTTNATQAATNTAESAGILTLFGLVPENVGMAIWLGLSAVAVLCLLTLCFGVCAYIFFEQHRKVSEDEVDHLHEVWVRSPEAADTATKSQNMIGFFRRSLVVPP